MMIFCNEPTVPKVEQSPRCELGKRPKSADSQGPVVDTVRTVTLKLCGVEWNPVGRALAPTLRPSSTIRP